MQEQIKKIISDICPFYKEYGSCEKCDEEMSIEDEPCYWACVAKVICQNDYRKQEWISIDDRLPEEREHVIVFCEDGLVGEAWHKKEGLFWWMDDRDGIAEAARYWMQLPEPPKMKGGAEQW